MCIEVNATVRWIFPAYSKNELEEYWDFTLAALTHPGKGYFVQELKRRERRAPFMVRATIYLDPM
jgi:hypothetical protein